MSSVSRCGRKRKISPSEAPRSRAASREEEGGGEGRVYGTGVGLYGGI